LALPIGKILRICARFGLGDKVLVHSLAYGDKCSHNENFHMDVIFHVWVDVTLNSLGFQVVEHYRF
jgi:hypothetical protein